MLAWLVVLPTTGWAQQRPDQEYRTTDPGADDRLNVRARFESEYYEFNNLDFRKLDETSDQAILDSDDRGAFAYTGASIALAYEVDPQVRLVFEAGHRGLWGDDQIGSVNNFGGFLYIPSMYVDLATSKQNPVVFRIGRQFYSIGGMGGARDYVMADVVDMVRVDVPLGQFGRLTVIPMNVFSVSADLAEVNFVSLLGQQFAETYDFRGDTLTRRYGAVLSLDSLGPAEVTAYAFLSDVGARGTGSDVSYDGALGNFSDNDGIANLGLRATATFADVVKPYAHFDVSSGIDHKEEVIADVDTNGFAYGVGLRIDGSSMLEADKPAISAELSYFDAYGPAFSANGQQYSHGFVGMKGQQAGGVLLNRFMGWHPTSYLGRNGVADQPHNLERITGTRVIHAEAGIELPSGPRAWFGYWLMQDGGVSFLNFGNLDEIDPPFGYSRSEFSAQRRLGKTLASEINFELGWKFGPYVEAFGGAATVMPGAFYETVVDRVAGTALGSPNPASPWSLYAGAQVAF